MSGSDIQLKEIVIQREYRPEDIKLRVIIGEINPKDTSVLLEQLTKSFPLHGYSLGHLKRVRRLKGTGEAIKLELLLCPEQDIDTMPTEFKDKFISTTSIIVCKVPPLTRSEYEEWNLWWPTNFRPNDVDREREKGHTADEILRAGALMRIVQHDANKCREFYEVNGGSCAMGGAGGIGSGGGILVNPLNGRVVACCHDVLQYLLSKRNPASGMNAQGSDGATIVDSSCNPNPYQSLFLQVLQSPTMLCVDGTAMIINEGATYPCHMIAADGDADPSPSSVLPDDPYLCTGLDLYVTLEPNLMSCMALVHSRIRRVFFQTLQPEHGALASYPHIHSLRSLNHKFRVYQCEIMEVIIM